MIDLFLRMVSQGLITGRADANAPMILQEMSEALNRILSGENPDVALQIERQAGGPKAQRNWTVAKILRAHEKDHGQMAAAYHAANTWLEDNGHKTLSEKRLRDILNAHRDELMRRESTTELTKKTNKESARHRKVPE